MAALRAGSSSQHCPVLRFQSGRQRRLDWFRKGMTALDVCMQSMGYSLSSGAQCFSCSNVEEHPKGVSVLSAKAGSNIEEHARAPHTALVRLGSDGAHA